MTAAKRFAIVLLFLTGLSWRICGQTLTTLYSFSGTDGNEPEAALIQGTDGNFYGTTYEGGNLALNLGNGYGVVFRISAAGNFTNLYSFSGGDGGSPQGGLVQGGDGNFYGTTQAGGTGTSCGSGGCGTVFRITAGGSLTTLHSFTGNDGAAPEAGLVQGNDGNFYGTTVLGGTNDNGTVFRISPGGSFTNLYLFTGVDGRWPSGGLTQGGDSNFYGTTVLGGTSTNCSSGCGTVFRISPSGNFTSLYSFSFTDGAAPQAPLAQGSDGNLYGTTQQGGSRSNYDEGYGTVFGISSSGAFASVHVFSGGTNGFVPNGLIQGSDGNLYGTTRTSGLQGAGTVFAISPAGAFANVFNLYYARVFAKPYGGLIQGSDGSFYGTTYDGGASFMGSVFKLSVPLNPPANQVSGVQLSGTDMVVAIPSVAGETYQLQFSDSISPANWSNVAGGCVSNSVGALMTLTNFGGASAPQGFYRFAITP